MNKTKQYFTIQITFLTFLILIFSSVSISAQTENNPTATKNYKFINGNWFDGKKFKRKTFYSVNGIFSNNQPRKIDETVDFKNGFIIPPFGDAHTHNLDGTRDLERMFKVYLEEGTFYVQVLGNYATGAKQADHF